MSNTELKSNQNMGFDIDIRLKYRLNSKIVVSMGSPSRYAFT